MLLIFIASVALTSQKTLADGEPKEKEKVLPDTASSIAAEAVLAKGPPEETPVAGGLLVGHMGPPAVKYVIFTNTHFPALDIGCGSEGDVCAVGINSRLYCYDFPSDTWEIINTNEEILNITAVDVDDDGKIYIIAQCGIYTSTCFNQWVKLPGTGKDIGVGVNFDVWKIGTDASGYDKYKKNYGVWKLFCECDCNCTCSRICLRFRKLNLNICEPLIRKRCFWTRVDIYGVAIDVFPNGDAAVVRESGDVYIVDGKTFEERKLFCHNYIKANDVTVGNNGVLYISDEHGAIWKFNFFKYMWELVKEATEKADRICASAYDILWYTKLDYFDYKKEVFTSARHDYLNFD